MVSTREDLTTWRQMIDAELSKYPGETLIFITDESVLDVEFDNGFGGPEGAVFTAWSQHRVLFPACYDGAEWVESVPRNPCEEATEHVGGF